MVLNEDSEVPPGRDGGDPAEGRDLHPKVREYLKEIVNRREATLPTCAFLSPGTHGENRVEGLIVLCKGEDRKKGGWAKSATVMRAQQPYS